VIKTFDFVLVGGDSCGVVGQTQGLVMYLYLYLSAPLLQWKDQSDICR